MEKMPMHNHKMPQPHEHMDRAPKDHVPSDKPHQCAHSHPQNNPAENETIYTCPMHPQIRHCGPGNCPICGMTLEPLKISVGENANEEEYRQVLFRFWVAAILSLPLIFFNMGAHFLPLQGLQNFLRSPLFNWVQFLIATPVVFWCGAMFFKRGWDSLITRNLNMFTLIALGIGVAYAYSLFITFIPGTLTALFGDSITLDAYYEPAAVITALALLGQVMELKARTQTGNAVRHLLDLAPETAIVLNENKSESTIAVKEIKKGMLLRIRPGDKIPVDGILVNGNSSIDQSMITGEPIPVEKNQNDTVIAGTLNGSGSFVMRAEKVGEETLLSQIVDMVSKAQRTKARIQKLADKVSSYFVPAVIIIALITFTVWSLNGPEPKIGYAVYTSIAVIIIACPCALGLATPMSIMVGTGRGAKDGVLIKNAEALETLARIDVLVLDKTGTITEGKPSLVKLFAVDQSDQESDLLEFAASLEKQSEHPLAEAILNAAAAQSAGFQEAENFEAIAGQGVTGIVSGKKVALGNNKLMETLGISLSSITQEMRESKLLGYTVMFLAIDKKLAGFLAVQDKVKEGSAEAIKALRQKGIRITMLSGDSPETAYAIAKSVGISEIKAGVLPQNKFEYIQELQDRGFFVAMAGDGINDAPALAQANVGIAMGTGTDIAMESAGIVLVSGNLKGILKAVELSRETIRNIKQNLFLAFIYNVISIPVAAGVLYPQTGLLLSPVIASAAMAFSSVSVILNALRLSKMK